MATFPARHGEDGADMLRKMDQDDVEALFRKACRGGTFGTFRNTGGGCAELTDEQQDAYETAIRKSDVEKDDLDEFLSDYDAETRAELKEFVAENGPAAAHLTRRLDEDAVQQLANLDADARDALVNARRAEGMEIATADVKLVLTRLDSLEAEHHTKAVRLLEDTDEAGVKLINEVDRKSLTRLFEYDGAGDRKMVARLSELHARADISTGQIETFSRDLDALRRADVDGVEHVIHEDIVKNGEVSNVQGAMYEFRVANARVDDLDTVRAIGREIETVEYDDLSDAQLEQLIKEIEFKDATTFDEKRDVVQNALSPNDQGQAIETEIDVLLKNGDYLEAKSGVIEYGDILDKVIRYKAAQLNHDVAPSDGVIKVIGTNGRFIDARNGELNKVGRFIRDTRGLTKGTESLQKGASSSNIAVPSADRNDVHSESNERHSQAFDASSALDSVHSLTELSVTSSGI